MRLMLQSLTTIALTVTALLATPVPVAAQADSLAQFQPLMRRPIPRDQALDFARTELFFGTSKPDGSAVTDAEFMRFLDEVITPRFPDGLTLLSGHGQFRNSAGVIVEEKSFLLILLYPLEDFRAGSRRIERIRTLYKARFQQESVLRADDPFASRISF
jgi:hypothetical protein